MTTAGFAAEAPRETPAPALLVLEDGRSFRGEAFGAAGEVFGEAVFSTGMTGYQETLTDPSYHRQVVIMTAPHVGNTGVNVEDSESARIWVAGYVVRDPARMASSWRASRSLDDELVAQGVVGIGGVDTRALTRHLREQGAMRVAISTTETDEAKLLARVRSSAAMAGRALAHQVSTDAAYTVAPVGRRRFRVVALDLGIKSTTPAQLASRGVEVVVVPASTPVDDLVALEPDGVFFSNGPGDPAAEEQAVEVLRGVLRRGVPFFGICLGNQLFGRALGFATYKLKYGHRGINQPVLDLTTGKVEVTAHNHGFAVGWPGREDGHGAVGWPGREDGHSEVGDRQVRTPYGLAEVTHVCLNDGVVEGLRLVDRAAFSVQYHPEAAAGPHDASYLFDRFVEMMSDHRQRSCDGGTA